MTTKRLTIGLLAALLMVPAIAFASPPGDEPPSKTPVSMFGASASSLSKASPESSADPQSAQAAAPDLEEATSLHTLFRDLGRDFVHLPSRRSLLIASVGGGLALAVSPADDTFNQRLAKSGKLFAAGDFLGTTPTIMGASFAAYVLGRKTKHYKIAHVGLDFIRAEILTEAMVETLKYTVRERRPNGGSGYSFPSGHSAVTFSTAAALEAHLGFPKALAVYGAASYVAMSRLHDNVHRLSDVVFGASVGILAGRTVVRLHGKSNFALMPVAMPGGAAILLVRNSGP
jgi:membrane-associated phospholipid phosphatase